MTCDVTTTKKTPIDMKAEPYQFKGKIIDEIIEYVPNPQRQRNYYLLEIRFTDGTSMKVNAEFNRNHGVDFELQSHPSVGIS